MLVDVSLKAIGAGRIVFKSVGILSVGIQKIPRDAHHHQTISEGSCSRYCFELNADVGTSSSSTASPHLVSMVLEVPISTDLFGYYGHVRRDVQT